MRRNPRSIVKALVYVREQSGGEPPTRARIEEELRSAFVLSVRRQVHTVKGLAARADRWHRKFGLAKGEGRARRAKEAERARGLAQAAQKAIEDTHRAERTQQWLRWYTAPEVKDKTTELARLTPLLRPSKVEAPHLTPLNVNLIKEVYGVDKPAAGKPQNRAARRAVARSQESNNQ